jgi:hypothetical protein
VLLLCLWYVGGKLKAARWSIRVEVNGEVVAFEYVDGAAECVS